MLPLPEVTIYLPGVIIATLQYDTLNSPFQADVEGLLFGYVRKRTKAQITDHAPDQTSDLLDIVVSSYITVPCHERYYDPAGRVNEKKLLKFVDPSKSNTLIGRFKFRRGCPLQPSLRDSAIYGSLQTSASPDSPLRNLQLLGLFTASTNETATIHNMDFAFFRKDGEGRAPFVKVPVKITNIVESSSTRHDSYLSSMPTDASFPNNPLSPLLRSLSQKHVEEQDRFFTHTLKLLRDATNQLVTSEQKAFAAEKAAYVPPPDVPSLAPHGASENGNGQLLGDETAGGLKRGFAQRRVSRSPSPRPPSGGGREKMLIDLT
ncbi:hypothetical protein HDV00_000600 [Rhizophlyctis rosea]|nr:hypothetical protein HDV00_000600 [Rhizophlyctis rosea]